METWVLLIGTILVWFSVEFYLVAKGKPTISWQFQNLFAVWPPFGVLVALAIGWLLGHWFG